MAHSTQYFELGSQIYKIKAENLRAHSTQYSDYQTLTIVICDGT